MTKPKVINRIVNGDELLDGKITKVENKSNTNANDIITLKDNMTTLENDIIEGLDEILEILL